MSSANNNKDDRQESKRFSAWRLQAAEGIASRLDPARFGVKALYLIGSTKNRTAGPASDIDLLIHFQGTEKQREALFLWLEGWSLCLDEINFRQTGCRTGGLLDIHLITDEDIASRTSYAVKIGSPTDAAKPLVLLRPPPPSAAAHGKRQPGSPGRNE
jgi:pyruvate,water dikinase